MPAATRCPGLPASGRSRSGVCSHRPALPQRRRPIGEKSPVRFSAKGGAKRRRSMLADVRGGYAQLFSTRRACAVTFSRDRAVMTLRVKQTKFPSSLIDSCRWFRGNRNTRSRAIRPLERLRFNPTPYPSHSPSRSFGAVFRTRGSWALAAWPGDWTSLDSPGGAHGVLTLRSFDPYRVDRHLCRSGPTCRSRRLARPD